MSAPIDRPSGFSATEQHDWMIETYDPAIPGKKGGWSDYWSVSTWTKSRKVALKKASSLMSSKPFRWRLSREPIASRKFDPLPLSVGETNGEFPLKKAAFA